MKEITATITQRGQVTVPAEVRRLLGVKPREKLAFTIEDGEVRISAVRYSLESAFRSVTPGQKLDDLEQESGDAKDEKAERTVREMRES